MRVLVLENVMFVIIVLRKNTKPIMSINMMKNIIGRTVFFAILKCTKKDINMSLTIMGV